MRLVLLPYCCLCPVSGSSCCCINSKQTQHCQNLWPCCNRSLPHCSYFVKPQALQHLEHGDRTKTPAKTVCYRCLAQYLLQYSKNVSCRQPMLSAVCSRLCREAALTWPTLSSSSLSRLSVMSASASRASLPERCNEHTIFSSTTQASLRTCMHFKMPWVDKIVLLPDVDSC